MKRNTGGKMKVALHVWFWLMCSSIEYPMGAVLWNINCIQYLTAFFLLYILLMSSFSGWILLFCLWMCSQGFRKLLGSYQWKETYAIPSATTLANYVGEIFSFFSFFKLLYLVSCWHVVDQRALGMSMRVERASLEQVPC